MSEQPLTSPSEGRSVSAAKGEAVQREGPRGGDAWKGKVTETGFTTATTGGFQDATGEGAR